MWVNVAFYLFLKKKVMLISTIIAVVLYVLVEKFPKYAVNIWLSKMLVQVYTLFGGLYAFSLIAEASDFDLFILFLYALVFLGVNFYIVGWRYADMSSEEIKDDAKNAMAMAKICPNCLKKLPSRMTKKCPHCTADL